MKWFLKYVFSKILTFILLPLYIFPIKKNKILFISYGGLQYSCNPKYISKYLQNNYNGKYELVWVFRSPEKFIFLDKSIKRVKYLSLKHFYHVITSQICITNMGFNKFFLVRDTQRFVQTWHGGGAYKKSGKTLDKNLFQHLLNRQHDNMITDFISSSKYFTEYFIRDLSYKRNILTIGMPRNSFLLNNIDNISLKVSIKKRFDKSYNSNRFYILYAPTWRDNHSFYDFPNFTSILKILEERLEKEIVILFRSHHFHVINLEKSNSLCIDVTDYPDMQELLLISDMLISDYSSSIWDFSLLYRPCFLYVPDLTSYESMRGFYTDIHDWGFDVCTTKNELERKISEFNQHSYNENIRKMHQKFGSYENRKSCEELLVNIGLM